MIARVRQSPMDYRSYSPTAERSIHPLSRQFSYLRTSAPEAPLEDPEFEPGMDLYDFSYPSNHFTADDCAECVTECQDVACPAATMTSQCTDQCVVVACSDPTHHDMSCHGAQHCDATCDTTTDCQDCDGFEEFVSNNCLAIIALLLIGNVASFNVAQIIMHISQMPDRLRHQEAILFGTHLSMLAIVPMSDPMILHMYLSLSTCILQVRI